MTRNSKRSASKRKKRCQKDAFAREASRLGVRARSYFKLQELDRKFDLFKPGLTVLDLGASPGGWSQYAFSKVGPQGKIFAVDILDMQPITGVSFLQLDLSGNETAEQVAEWLGQCRAHIVISDMAPNITGNSTIDERNFSDLYSSIFAISDKILQQSGSLVFKFFQTDSTAILREKCQLLFESSTVYKPKASRSRSQETYMVARGHKPQIVVKSEPIQ